ncbi:MAG: hypothetical protein MJ001_04195 [Paludibacteraceae bacterium]|nr:hypothetical protein [Paludibacteraceae bacterium]
MLWTIISTVISLAGIVIPFWISSRKYNISYTEHIDRLYQFQKGGDVDVSVSYKGEKCKDPFVISNVILKNEGTKDIVFNHKFDRPILINSPVITIVDIKCTQSNAEINSKAILKGGNSIFLSWGILKKGESISIDIFGNVTSTNTLSQLERHYFNVGCRASDINKITQKRHKMNMYQKLILILFVLCFCGQLITLASNLRNVSLVGDITYKNEVIDNATILYNVFTDKYYISTTEKRIDRDIPVEDVTNITVSQCKLPSTNYRLVNLTLFVVLAIIVVLMYAYLYKKVSKYPTYMIHRNL